MSPEAAPLLRARALCCGYETTAVVQGVDTALYPGNLYVIVGANGAGKSTLLATLAGVLAPLSGELELAGSPLESRRGRERAREIAWLPHAGPAPEGFSVREVVAQGRYAHLGPFDALGVDDERIITRCAEQVDIAALLDRDVSTLSAGELRRALLARMLTQDTGLMLLDEPAANLDVRHKLALYAVLRGAAAEQKRAVMVSEHDLDFAACYADHIIVLHKGRVRAAGPPAEVFTAELVREVFDVDVEITRQSGRLRVKLEHGP